MKTSKADKYFSMYIRLRDADENGLCTCITCGKKVDLKRCDCGHYVKRQHAETRFNEMNCHSQCKHCNAFEQGRDSEYRRKLIEMYGEEKVLILETAKHKTGKLGQYQLDYLTKLYKLKATELSRIKNIELW